MLRYLGLCSILLLGPGASTAQAKSRAPKARPSAAKASEARPPEPQDPLARGIALYEQGRFGASLQILEPLTVAGGDAQKTQQAKLYLGLNYLALGNEARVTQVFGEVLDKDPGFTLTGLKFSPSVRAFFAKTKEAHRIVPILTHVPPTEIVAAAGVDINVDIAPMTPEYEPRLYYRVAGRSRYSHIDLSPRVLPHYLARIPPALLNTESSGYSLEYYAAVTSQGVTVAQLRSAGDPFSVPVSVVTTEAAPVYKKWWFWTALATVAAGAAATTVYLVSTAQNPLGNAHVVLHVQ